MSNTLGVYNPIFYANEALIQLENALGMGMRIHRGFEAERKSFGLGDTINIRRPSTFTAQDAPSTAQDLVTATVPIVLNRWKEVKFKLTDKELTLTKERIIEDHIRPAAYALANEIDVFCSGFANSVPWFYDLNAAPGSVVGDITGPRKIMFNNGVPMGDASMLHYMVDGAMEANLLGMAAFAQWQGAGSAGAETQRTGALGQRYGFGFFANQNVQSHTAGTSNDTALQVLGNFAAGVSTIALDAVDGTVAGTIAVGDSFVIAGNTQRYSVTALSTASGNAFATVAIVPPLAAAVVDNAAVTLRLDTNTSNLAFHRNFAALCVVPLTDMASQLGARVATVFNEKSAVGLRSRIYYVGNSSEVHVALDVLYGGVVLDPNLACVAAG